MKAYCMNCGHPTEYSAAPPRKCEKCGLEFAKAKVEFTLRIKPEEQLRPIKEVIQEQLEDSDFDSFMEGSAEAISEDEIQKIFLKGAGKSVNFRDMVAEARESGKKPPKVKKRVVKSSRLRVKKTK